MGRAAYMNLPLPYPGVRDLLRVAGTHLQELSKIGEKDPRPSSPADCLMKKRS